MSSTTSGKNVLRTLRLDRVLLWVAHVGTLVVIVSFAIGGLDYYLEPLGTRARHPAYWELKPGGELGLRFGYAGAIMMTLLLLYSVRKRVPALRRLGTLRKWLDWHIFLGIYGPLFIVLHSSLKVGGLVSISFWSMVAVALSGVLGRFLYKRIPRSEGGEEIPRPELVAEDERLRLTLASKWGIDAAHVDAVVEASATDLTRRRGLLGLILRLPFEPFALRLRVARHVRGWDEVDPRSRRKAAATAYRLARSHHRLLLLDRTRELFRLWHVVHKPFALILYTLMIVHVAVAWVTGYGRLS